MHKDESDNHYYEKFEDGTINDITEEIPFDIPDNWCWTRLCNVLEVARGGSPRPIQAYLTEADNGINWIKIGDTEKGGKYINSTKEKIIPEGMKKSRFVRKGDFILSNSMSFGRPYILNIDGCIHDGWLVFSNIDTCFFKDYLYYLLSSNFIYSQFCSRVSGAVVNNLNSDKVKSTFIPLPPINEQIKIVNKIEQFFPYIEKYEDKHNNLELLSNSYKGDLRKSILQYAIQGKIVKQNPNDESAEVLINKILDEKRELIKTKQIKKENLSVIYKDDTDNQFYEKFDDGTIINITNEITIDIPQNWRWTRLRNIVYNHGQKKPDTTFSYIDIGTLDNINHKLNENENIIEADQAPSRARKIVKKGDVLYSTVRPYLHNICIVDKEFSKEPIASTGFAVLTCLTGIYNKYLFYLLLTPFFDSYANSNENARGVAYPAINDEKLYKALIPIPPTSEQKNIVDKLEKLFNIIG